MGAKQSKRSVDISGKEAEAGAGAGAGEVAAAGAGGEGRVEPLADADALKPQLNGDAHIQCEPTDKEKELDSGTPENEKDATTEKEGKEENEKESEAAPVTNGEAEEKLENGESTPTPEDGKKPKKEKVKKKWSLRSISFSRKDKPKQEKKQKDEEPKTNGEPEKVPEETAEATAEPAAKEAIEEVATPVEVKEEQTPSTPETEPLGNGTGVSTPSAEAEAEKEASLPAEPAPAPAPTPAPVHITEPEQLPVNGLSLDTKPEEPEPKLDESAPEPPAAEPAEIAPAPEIPAKEVCVRPPLLEPAPPPLPANPPPSVVASFAASTMAPEADPDTASRLSALPPTKITIDELIEPLPSSPAEAIDQPSLAKEISEDKSTVADAIEPQVQTEVVTEVSDGIIPDDVATSGTEAVTIAEEATPVVSNTQNDSDKVDLMKEEPVEISDTSEAISVRKLVETPVAGLYSPEPEVKQLSVPVAELISEPTIELIPESQIEHIPAPEIEQIAEPEMEDIPAPAMEDIPAPAMEDILAPEMEQIAEPEVEQIPEPEIEQIPEPEIEQIPEPEMTTSEIDDAPLPPPPAQDDIDMQTSLGHIQQNGDVDEIVIPDTEADVALRGELRGEDDASDAISVTAENLKNKTKVIENGVKKTECNGDACDKDRDSAATAAAASAPHTPQEPVSVSDKLADLIPEVPDVPEINTEMLQETATDVAVAN